MIKGLKCGTIEGDPYSALIVFHSTLSVLRGKRIVAVTRMAEYLNMKKLRLL